MKLGLIVIDHGSKRNAANDLLHEVCALLKRQSGTAYVAVQPAHMELASPTLADATRACVQAGADTITISQFFLAPGRHTTQDIPAMLDEMREHYPTIRFQLTAPLGCDELLIDLLIKRIQQATPS